MSKTTNKFSPEARERAIRMVLDHKAEHPNEMASGKSGAVQHAPDRCGRRPEEQSSLSWLIASGSISR
ncbi:hypothetical protein NOJ05_29410 [Neorhizobium galegae]|uniref:hypothetical protein n=1 Tax=Neorhizobium galegae TaxID=399 RepID=UPI0009BA4D59|nr:hypothetical protein [Neorhizobium galegae]MCQ1766754.1 hypothetical protein [Neorhizobium galegae]MCQ1781325.1 hypothetical protein [Neorhizobium galegae]MCQ1849443.1 hypothetical protein [Neorhizobium galegae]